jgi:hypothetical protein
MRSQSQKEIRIIENIILIYKDELKPQKLYDSITQAQKTKLKYRLLTQARHEKHNLF